MSSGLPSGEPGALGVGRRRMGPCWGAECRQGVGRPSRRSLLARIAGTVAARVAVRCPSLSGSSDIRPPQRELGGGREAVWSPFEGRPPDGCWGEEARRSSVRSDRKKLTAPGIEPTSSASHSKRQTTTLIPRLVVDVCCARRSGADGRRTIVDSRESSFLQRTVAKRHRVFRCGRPTPGLSHCGLAFFAPDD